MRLNLPFNDQFPLFQIVVNYPGGEQSMTVDDSHRVIDIKLPAGILEDDVEIIGCPLLARGVTPAGCGPCLIKERVERPQPVVEQPAEAPVEPAIAPALEPEQQSSHNET